MPRNYKPISLTCVIGRTLERRIKARITCLLDKNNLFNDTQNRFRSKLSDLANLLFSDKVTEIYDENKVVDFIYLDYQKTFDKALHERFMKDVKASV